MVADQPWRRPLVILMTAVVGLVCLLVGFGLGQNREFVDRVTRNANAAELEQAQARIDELQSSLIDARLAADVQREASQALRRDLTKMRERGQRLDEEVTFYKSLMAPGSLVKGLQVTELELRNTDDNRMFNFELLLTQVALRRTYISGNVRLDIIGRFAEGKYPDEFVKSADSAAAEQGDPQNTEVVLSLTEVSEVESYPLKFKFRYFQDLAGDIELPEHFLPARVLVTAQQQGKEALQESFPWPQW